MSQGEFVSLKGTGDGVVVRVSGGKETGEVIRIIVDKIRENRSFFRGCCNVYIESETLLTKSDEIRLKSVIDTFLPECTVIYRAPGHNDKKMYDGQSKKARYNTIVSKGAVETASVYEGDIHAYEHFRVVGNALIIGNVEEKAIVTAGGNVTVLGNISGDVRAGYPDNPEAYILFNELMGGELFIGQNTYKNDIYNMQNNEENDKKGLKKAQSINNSIFIMKFL